MPKMAHKQKYKHFLQQNLINVRKYVPANIIFLTIGIMASCLGAYRKGEVGVQSSQRNLRQILKFL